MTAKVIQGSFVGAGPRLPSPVAQPKAMPRLAGPPAPAFAGRPPVAQRHLPGPPAPAIAGRPPGPPAPAFAARPPVAQLHGAGDAFSVDPGQLGLANGGGRPLPDAVRGKMEAALGADFSGVRVYVGPQAERIGAIAFTLGSDIYFAPGRFQPETAHGQQLLGHELAHVVQQRQGRVRNPIESGVAVVQDRALEAEADRLGQRAAAHRVVAQPKMTAGAVQPSSPVRISAPISAGPGSYRLTAGAGGRQVGSVMVHARDKASVEVTDLGVDPAHREQGIGQMLLASAARSGLQSGKSKVTLAAQDNGSGRLTQWYKDMGFARIGVNHRGYPQLEAPISRVLAGTLQQFAAVPRPLAAPVHRPNTTSPIVQRKAGVPPPARLPARSVAKPQAAAHGSSVIQRMDTEPTRPSKILHGLATPKTYPPVDVDTQKDVAAEINKLILKGKINDAGKPPDVCCLGGIVLPASLDRPLKEIIGSADLVKITPATGIYNAYDAIGKRKKLKQKIVSLMISTAEKAGQLEYLRESSLGIKGWKIVIEVHYYYKRSSSDIGFHKDTLGQTLFVNLMYMNEDWIAGPEYILNPPRISAHDTNTEDTLPYTFREDLKTVRDLLPPPTHIEASFIPSYGFVAFTDEIIHHTTPNIGPRTVSPKEIKLWLRVTTAKMRGVTSQEYANLEKILNNQQPYTNLEKILTNQSEIDSILPKDSKWRSLLLMAIAPEGKRYTRGDFQKKGVPSIAIDQLLDATHERGYAAVAVPNAAGGPIDPKRGRKQRRWPIAYPGSAPLKLTRRMSQNTELHKAFLKPVEADTPRCFFRVWIRAVPANAAL